MTGARVIAGALVACALSGCPGSSSAPATVTTAPVSSAAPAGMVWVEAAELVMGTDDPRSMPNERPAHRVKVEGFWLDAHEVTNAEFRAFVAAAGYVTTAERAVDWEELKKQVAPGTPRPPDEALRPGALVFTPPDHSVDLRDLNGWWTWTAGADWRHPQGPASAIEGKDDLPVVQVSWEDAAAYAAWAGKRLPTEAEWELAGGNQAATTRYWWGDEVQPTTGPFAGKVMCNIFTGAFPAMNTAADGFPRSAPVRSFPASSRGLYDMAGNVWEWTADLYRADAHALPAGAQPTECFDPTREVPSQEQRVIKGGSFLCHPSYCESYRPTARRGTPPDTGTEHIGFRCARSATP